MGQIKGAGFTVAVRIRLAGLEYLQHINADGVIAVHISNRYLNLQPVVTGIARRFDLEMIPIYSIVDDEDDNVDINADASSKWVLLTRTKRLRDHPLVAKRATETEADYDTPITWTDQYSNVLQVLW